MQWLWLWHTVLRKRGKGFMLEKPNGGAKIKLRKGENFTAKHNLIKDLFFYLFKRYIRGPADANY